MTNQIDPVDGPYTAVGPHEVNSCSKEHWEVHDGYGRTATVCGDYDDPEVIATAHLLARSWGMLRLIQKLEAWGGQVEMRHGRLYFPDGISHDLSVFTQFPQERTFEFTVKMVGKGRTPEDAWEDAKECWEQGGANAQETKEI